MAIFLERRGASHNVYRMFKFSLFIGKIPVTVVVTEVSRDLKDPLLQDIESETVVCYILYFVDRASRCNSC